MQPYLEMESTTPGRSQTGQPGGLQPPGSEISYPLRMICPEEECLQ